MKCYICAKVYVWDRVFVNRSKHLEPETSVTLFLKLSFSVIGFAWSTLTNKILFFDELTKIFINRIINISANRPYSFEHTCAIIEGFRNCQKSILSSLRAHFKLLLSKQVFKHFKEDLKRTLSILARKIFSLIWTIK